MAVRTSVFSEGHHFDEGIGPDGTVQYGVGSESEFTSCLARAGHLAYFVADARVAHIVRPEQLEEDWMIKRAYRHGLGFYRYHQHLLKRHNRRIFGVPLGIMARHLLYGLVAPVVRFLPSSKLRLRVLFQDQWYRGLADSLTKPTR